MPHYANFATWKTCHILQVVLVHCYSVSNWEGRKSFGAENMPYFANIADSLLLRATYNLFESLGNSQGLNGVDGEDARNGIDWKDAHKVCIRTDASNELLHLGGQKIASVWESSETDPAKVCVFGENNSSDQNFFSNLSFRFVFWVKVYFWPARPVLVSALAFCRKKADTQIFGTLSAHFRISNIHISSHFFTS